MQVPRGALITVVALLVVSLLTVGYLLGQRNTGPNVSAPLASASPSRPQPVVAAEAKDQSLEDRLDALEKRVASRQQQVGQLKAPTARPSAAPVPGSTSPSEARSYLKQLDAIMGKSAFDSPRSFSERLLPQAMAGSDKELDELINRTAQAREQVRALNAPTECRPHQDMVVAQLDDALRLLEGVKKANITGDSASLKALTHNLAESQRGAVELQTLDRRLREEF